MEPEEGESLDMYRNSSEELFLKLLMESSVGMPAPTMEMLGFKNLSQSFRTDSEELFKSWLKNGENHGQNLSSIAHRGRQASRRMSTELANLTSQQNGENIQKKRSNEVLFLKNNYVGDENAGDPNQQSVRNAVERGKQASNLFLAKAWFHSSQPMTRSRSSELRRRYAAMQSTQTALGMEAMHNASIHGVNKLKDGYSNQNGFNEAPTCEIPVQLGMFVSPSNSSSSTFSAPQTGNVDKVSSVVRMLKGTLERKNLTNQIEEVAVEDSSNGLYHYQEPLFNTNFIQGQGNYIHDMISNFQVLPGQVSGNGVVTVQGWMNLDKGGFANPTNTIQPIMVSHEPSQSESSAAAPLVSSGLDACDGPSNSSQTLGVGESSRKQIGSSKSPENGSKAKDLRDRIIDNLKEDKKRRNLARYGSVASACSVDKADPTKKRRVERSRKMAEAKERNLTPAIPSDMQAVLKRYDSEPTPLQETATLNQIKRHEEEKAKKPKAIAASSQRFQIGFFLGL
ncbi:uncharacterized protein LOC110811398 [Carica papaya]|uniref:uncharacterized protein LOC110811398 n=1 Tax=Carica papaya TaxID=3649 RepID=UPI000B8CF293|nr:uncharacterized protein LOC110811398 [Carica papaya]